MIWYIFLIPQVAANLTMTLVWGQPDSISQCNNTGTSNFTNCYSLCFYKVDCVIAYMNDSDNICYLCGYQSVKNVIQNTYENGMKVGMKINMSVTNCQAQYPVDGQVDYGFLEVSNQQLVTYNISFNTGSWIFRYTIMSCPTGWQLFLRQKGPWCIKVNYDPINYYNWTDANSQCQSQGALLSGMENSAEHDYIYSTAINEWTTGFGNLWLGAQRVAECTYPAWNDTICNNKSTVFEWTDGFTTGTEGFYNWGSNSPDGYFVAGTNSSDCCLQMWMYKNSIGVIDDQSCSYAANIQNNVSSSCLSAYACGKRANETFA